MIALYRCYLVFQLMSETSAARSSHVLADELPSLRITSPSLGIASPSLGITSPFLGIAPPSLGIAHLIDTSAIQLCCHSAA